MRLVPAFAIATLLLATSSARADVIHADPSNYRDRLGDLSPGDVLELAPGTYTRLTLRDLHGTPEAWIVIRGPASGEPAIIEGESCCNTVQLYGCSYLAIENLVIDARGLYVDGINAKDSISHDIRIEGNTLRGFPNSQSIVGISTKSTAWNWVIRRNLILEAGTGLYLGNSDGNAPFIAGTIEENVVLTPVGYCMQVKHQNPYSLGDGMPEGPNTTIIRHNVFIKDDRPSTSGDRPNLLVGGFPESGPGSMDRYEIYGNFLYYNPRESLFQGAGRMSIHDNVFVGTGSDRTAILLMPHHGKQVQLAHIYNNTIYGVSRGIRFASAATESDGVVGNLIFADDPISGTIAHQADNAVDSISNAGTYVNAPGTVLGEMDFYPVEGGGARGTALDLSAFASDVDHDRDFNGTAKGDWTYRGAYAGAGANPGWMLTDDFKDLLAGGPGTRTDGGTATGDGGAATGDGGASTGGSDGSTSGGSSDAGSLPTHADEGCGCATPGIGGSHPGAIPASLAMLMAIVLARRSRRESRPARRGRTGTSRQPR